MASSASSERFGRRRPGDWRNGISLLVLAVLVVGFFALRTVLVSAAPGLGGLYARLGMPVNVRGLDFRNVGVTRDSVGGSSGLVVTGEIFNPGGPARPLPALRFTLYDERGREVGGWSASVDQPPVSGGDALPFRSRLADPPDAAREVSLRFEDAKERKP